MEDDPGEALSELRERRLSALELLQAAAGSGLAAYVAWALLLQPGFRRVPLRLQVRGGAAAAAGGGAGAGPPRLQGARLGAGRDRCGCRGRGRGWGPASSAPQTPDSSLGTRPRLLPCPGALCRCE